MKIKILPTFFFVLALFAAGYSQTLDKAKLDKFFDTLAEKNKAMGSLAISKNGNVIYSRAVGYSQILEKEKKPSTASTKYRIGSITKMFTATMIFQLVEEGKLKLTDTLDKFFPQVPNAKLITVGNLLNHRSGLHNFTSDAEYLSYFGQPKTQDEMLAVITKSKPDFEPNGRADYSNSNYLLLGYIIEKVSKKSYQTVLKEKITAKIGLSNTYLGGKTNVGAGESYSYNYTGDWKLSPETNMSIPGGAGAMVSTPTDLTKFIEALFSLKLVSETSLNQMKTMTDGYGMGMFQYPVYGKKAFGHNGGIDGFNSMLVYVPEENLAVSYVSNGMVYPINDILLGVFAVYLNQPFSIPTFETITVKAEDLDKYTGVYSSPEVPLKITVTKDKTTLFAQATGQSAFPLEATAKDKFKFDTAGVVVEFDTEKNQMTLKQGSRQFLFTKDK
ncbi:MAG: beta-lactamase family protein [Acidobacteriota bacterium]|nr:beta-lactamase family protein [Acidobacteriota bacterium]